MRLLEANKKEINELNNCNRKKEAIKNQLNFSDMVDSMIDKEEILNDLRDKYA